MLQTQRGKEQSTCGDAMTSKVNRESNMRWVTAKREKKIRTK